VAEVVKPLADSDVDVIVLACTHFSFLRPVIWAMIELEVIDPARAVAAQAKRVAPRQSGGGDLQLVASGDTDEFAHLASAVASMAGPVIRFSR